METIKIAIEVNVNLSEATQAFVKNLFGMITKPAVSAPTATQPAPATSAPVKPQPTAPTVQPVAPAPSKSVVESVPGQPAAPVATSVSIEQVRKALAEKVNEHRVAIKQKLNELGAPSVTKLDPAKYEEMYNFLTSL